MISLKGLLCPKLLIQYKIILLPILAISFLLNLVLFLHMPTATQRQTVFLRTYLKNDPSQAEIFDNFHLQQPRMAKNFGRRKNRNIDGFKKSKFIAKSISLKYYCLQWT